MGESRKWSGVSDIETFIDMAGDRTTSFNFGATLAVMFWH